MFGIFFQNGFLYLNIKAQPEFRPKMAEYFFANTEQTKKVITEY
jgi:hypothetical protein